MKIIELSAATLVNTLYGNFARVRIDVRCPVPAVIVGSVRPGAIRLCAGFAHCAHRINSSRPVLIRFSTAHDLHLLSANS